MPSTVQIQYRGMSFPANRLIKLGQKGAKSAKTETGTITITDKECLKPGPQIDDGERRGGRFWRARTNLEPGLKDLVVAPLSIQYHGLEARVALFFQEEAS
jgi:hypothetical protein